MSVECVVHPKLFWRRSRQYQAMGMNSRGSSEEGCRQLSLPLV